MSNVKWPWTVFAYCRCMSWKLVLYCTNILCKREEMFCSRTQQSQKHPYKVVLVIQALKRNSYITWTVWYPKNHKAWYFKVIGAEFHIDLSWYWAFLSTEKLGCKAFSITTFTDLHELQHLWKNTSLRRVWYTLSPISFPVICIHVMICIVIFWHCDLWGRCMTL